MVFGAGMLLRLLANLGVLLHQRLVLHHFLHPGHRTGRTGVSGRKPLVPATQKNPNLERIRALIGL